MEAKLQKPSACNYIFTNPCMERSLFVAIGMSIGTLITLSADHPDKFMEIMNYPTNVDLDFPLSASIGILIFAVLVIAAFASLIKRCQKQEEVKGKEFLNYIDYSNGSSAPALLPPNLLNQDQPLLQTPLLERFSRTSSEENKRKLSIISTPSSQRKNSSPDSNDSTSTHEEPLLYEHRVPEEEGQDSKTLKN